MPQMEDKPRPLGIEHKIPYPILNQHREMLRRQYIGTPGQVHIDNYGDRLVVKIPPASKDNDLELALFVVLEEYDDYLLCAAVNLGLVNAAPGEETYDLALPVPPIYDAAFGAQMPENRRIWIAKPYHLQRTPWQNQVVNGVGYTYSGVNSTTVWPPAMDHPAGVRLANTTTTERITPAYFPGDIIIARLGPTGYANPYTIQAPSTNPEDYQIVWQDMNCAARKWATNQASATGHDTKLMTHISGFSGVTTISSALWVDVGFLDGVFTLSENSRLFIHMTLPILCQDPAGINIFRFRLKIDGVDQGRYAHFHVRDGETTFQEINHQWFVDSLAPGSHTLVVEGSVGYGGETARVGTLAGIGAFDPGDAGSYEAIQCTSALSIKATKGFIS